MEKGTLLENLYNYRRRSIACLLR